MIEQSADGSSYEGATRGRSPISIVLSVLALFLVLVLSIYLTIPAKEYKAPEPDPTAQAIRDLQTSLQQTVDQLKALQLKVSSDQAERSDCPTRSTRCLASLRPFNNRSQVLSRPRGGFADRAAAASETRDSVIPFDILARLGDRRW